MSNIDENLIKLIVFDQDELVCRDESTDPICLLCFFYDTVFIKLGLRLPLTLFEKELLMELNVHRPNYIRTTGPLSEPLIILYALFGIVSSLNIFFYFFRIQKFK